MQEVPLQWLTVANSLSLTCIHTHTHTCRVSASEGRSRLNSTHTQKRSRSQPYAVPFCSLQAHRQCSQRTLHRKVYEPMHCCDNMLTVGLFPLEEFMPLNFVKWESDTRLFSPPCLVDCHTVVFSQVKSEPLWSYFVVREMYMHHSVLLIKTTMLCGLPHRCFQSS